jgi:DNA-binding LytR/AlgR family response regulator
MRDLNCIIVEDEPLAMRVMEDFARQTPGLALKSSCYDVASAVVALEQDEIDLIFLDINLPKVSGLDFLKKLDKKYQVVLTTAYHQYAVDSFEFNAMDYLLKPITYERFLKAVVKVKDYIMLLESQVTPEQPIDYLFIRSENKFEKIAFREIQYVQAMQNYVVIQTLQKRFITHITLKSIEQMLPKKRFVKTHKSYIVSLEKIDRITTRELEIGAAKIPISRSLRDEVMAVILDENLVTRENKKG